jgi:hypothetical protein
MWAIENQTPFAVERTFVRDKDGSEIWLVAVRATFDLSPDGRLRIAKEQNPVAQFPEYVEDPAGTPLKWESDLPRTKKGTDVLVLGNAWVPSDQREATEIEVGLRVASINKVLRVTGEQVWQPGAADVLSPSPPKRFRSIPIGYDRAFGGKPTPNLPQPFHIHSQRNPIGVGLVPAAGERLPNIHHVAGHPLRPSTSLPVAGFGPIACHWTPRRELAGTYDDQWAKQRKPLVPLDFDDAYFQSAPADQVVNGFLRGGESVELTHLTPDGTLSFQLPRYSFGFRTSIASGVEYHRGNLHTVIIEPDSQRLTMVWHTAFPCHHTLYTLTRTIVYVKQEKLAQVREAAI